MKIAPCAAKYGKISLIYDNDMVKYGYSNGKIYGFV